MKQTTSHIFMAEPMHFAFNEQAAKSNSFQNKSEITPAELKRLALKEFNQAVEMLRSYGVEVTVIKGDQEICLPDAVFPNNWFSTHETGELILYPMATENRRAERREDVIQGMIKKFGYRKVDLSHYEEETPPKYLEGTGSLVFDHTNKIMYAALSPRTSEDLVQEVAQILGYEAVCFHAFGKGGELIYHTNVMMCVGETFILIGKDTIEKEDLPRVDNYLQNSGKEVLILSNTQVYNHFAGNMLQVSNGVSQSLLVMSATAMQSLSETQLETLSKHNDYLVALDIPTIEFVGGGSARCMLAEVW
ncbi:MAG: citrulline utilization hydrolase CtlX [Fluviicola sp.]